MTYQLATIQSANGPRAAMILDGRAVDIAAATGRRTDETVLGLLEALDETIARLDALAATNPAGVALGSVTLLSPIPVPPAIYCAGSNYADHAREMAKANGREPPKDPHELGQRSWHFIKASRCAVGTGAVIAMPAHSSKLDWEAELGVVMPQRVRSRCAGLCRWLSDRQ